MRSFQVVLLFLAFNPQLISQEITINGYTATELKEQCFIGFSSKSTLGVDLLEGEENLYGNSIGEYDLRIIQRDSVNFSCSYDFGNQITLPHYYPSNIDLKKDIRPNKDGINGFFEVINLTKNFNLIEVCDSQNKLSLHVESIHFVSNYCDTVSIYSDEEGLEDPFTHCIGIITAPELQETGVSNILIKFKDIVTSNVQQIDSNNDILIYPNPVIENITIRKLDSSKIYNYFIYNFSGEVISKGKIPRKMNSFQLKSPRVKGLYNLVLVDERGKILTSKFYKE